MNGISSISQLCIHFVGNKLIDEGLIESSGFLNLEPDVQEIVKDYFLSAFKTPEYYNFYHESNLKQNPVFGCITEIFKQPGSLYEQSLILARHLYEQSVHPKIKAGEFYVVYFKDCLVDEQVADAVGLFKTENKDIFLNVYPVDDNYEIATEEGINIHKLDKGCLVFNTEKEEGYRVAMVDNSGRGSEANYWKNDFLHLRPRNDNFHQTQNLLSMCKSFVVDELPSGFEVSKADQADMLNKSVKFFKDKDTFNMEEFTGEVIEDPEVVKAFNDYKRRFVLENDLDIDDGFSISEDAVKKQQRVFKSVIKLDKNFHIYVHGNKNLIERGFDQATGMYFYKVFFKEEN
jgi:hypothetical protein